MPIGRVSADERGTNVSVRVSGFRQDSGLVRSLGGMIAPGTTHLHAEKVFVAVNGVRQGMFLKSTDAAKPVLLFLHGGPGMPEYFLDRTHPTGLEDDFTVCWWEQRGAGISYRRDIPPGVDDDGTAHPRHHRGDRLPARALRPGEDLPAGALLGRASSASRWPRGRRSGTTPTSAWPRSRISASPRCWPYEYVLDQFREGRGREDGAQARGGAGHHGRAAAAGLPEGARRGDAQPGRRYDARHEVGGHGRVPARVAGRPATRCGEKIALWRGKTVSRGVMWDDFLATDLAARVTELEIPVYFFEGVTTTPALRTPPRRTSSG